MSTSKEQAPVLRIITDKEIRKNTLKISKIIKKNLKKEIKKGKVAIVAIARGGLIPAQYLAYDLGIRDISTVTSRLYEGKKKGKKEQEIGNLFMIDYESPDYIIVVDDIYDSGETMQGLLYAMSEIASTFKEDVKLIPCTVFTQKSKEFMYDEGILYGSRIKKIDGQRPWLIFPWDFKDLKALEEHGTE